MDSLNKKILIATLSLEHQDVVYLLQEAPVMEDRIKAPLFGSGVITGLNDNYGGTGQTWMMVKWDDGRESGLRYEIVGS